MNTDTGAWFATSSNSESKIKTLRIRFLLNGMITTPLAYLNVTLSCNGKQVTVERKINGYRNYVAVST